MKSRVRSAAILPCLAVAFTLACADAAGAPASGPGDRSSPVGGDALAAGSMTQVTDFGDNPGALEMVAYVPEGLPAGAPLVVVLHGCTQKAADMVPAGWNALADENGFAVVYPQQTSANNPVTCFNWAGEYGDTANLVRGQGENQSIASMVTYMIDNQGIDAKRVYISGFSAGGAFTAVMLATWPDMFAAGAINSGVPYRCATSVNGATNCQQMNSHPEVKKSPEEWGQLVRDADPGYDGPMPRVSIWHGEADTFTVHYDNLTELVKQWTNVHGLDQNPTVSDTVAGAEHQAFVKDGRLVVESYLVPGMGHATAMGADDPDVPCAIDGFAQYFEDKGICSPRRIAAFFGLTGQVGPGPGCDPADPDCASPADDAAPPTVDISAPSAGSLVSGTVTVSVEADDDVGIDRVELYVDGKLQETVHAAPYEFSWPTAAFGEGDHELMAMAYDAAGNVSVDDDTGVEVDNNGDGAESAGFSGCNASGRSSGAPAALLLLLLLGLLWRLRSGRESRR